MIIIRKHQEVRGNITQMIQKINNNIALSELFKYKIKTTGKSPGSKDVKIVKIFK